MKAYILGLDVSTTCCGWALLSLDYADDRDLRYGKIIAPKKASWFVRCDFILGAINTYLADAPVAAIAMEQLNSFRGAGVTRQIAGIGALVSYNLYKRYGIETIEMHTTTVKKAFSGSGAAKKWDMIAAANKRYGLALRWPETAAAQKNKEHNDEDVADAIAVASTLYDQSGEDIRAGLAEEGEDDAG
jgi:Holliday junction resolvasome RuvABC endonuclease subunit